MGSISQAGDLFLKEYHLSEVDTLNCDKQSLQIAVIDAPCFKCTGEWTGDKKAVLMQLSTRSLEPGTNTLLTDLNAYERLLHSPSYKNEVSGCTSSGTAWPILWTLSKTVEPPDGNTGIGYAHQTIHYQVSQDYHRVLTKADSMVLSLERYASTVMSSECVFSYIVYRMVESRLSGETNRMRCFRGKVSTWLENKGTDVHIEHDMLVVMFPLLDVSSKVGRSWNADAMIPHNISFLTLIVSPSLVGGDMAIVCEHNS